MIYCKRDGCGMAISWAKTPKGATMAVDFLPSDDGTVVFENGLAVVLTKDDPRRADVDVPKWRTHWATCKNPPERKKS